ncbi:hypothetical protein [Streptomyces sp900129855]|uniref:Uncharacterized protein n=1 Tax=Streptomyces sp. 900129855 TaxID=3155129 RepID=A0ABV2ZQH9_9ACTN
MTPWQRALCGMRVGAVGAVGALGVVVLPCGATPAYAAVSAYGHVPPHVTVSASATPAPSSPEADRAGSRAGEGRERPGRKVDQGEDEDEEAPDTAGEDTGEEDSDEGSGDTEAGDGDPTGSESPQAVVAPATSATPQDAVRQPDAQSERADGPVLQILPLGTGLVLIGLGIALALAALRLRRG